jgi:hypothetical protein
MHRRGFLGLILFGSAGFASRATSTSRDGRIVHCHVAGVAYQTVHVSSLKRAEHVLVVPNRYRSEVCFKVLDMRGETIGFVPRRFLARLEHAMVKDAWVSAVNPHAVPWKQVEIGMLLGSTSASEA